MAYKQLDPIISGKSILVLNEIFINEIIFMNRNLPFHTSREKRLLTIRGIIVRKSVDKTIKQFFKEK